MYGKVFTSIWDGSLYGHLEATATLMALVTLCNAEGVVDMTPEAISGRTGWPLDFIRKGIADLEAPDDRSRSEGHEGRRLVRMDEHRDWGWLILNYKKYREKKDLDVERIQTRERVRRFRERNTPYKGVTVGNAPVTTDNGSKRQAEAEAEAIRGGDLELHESLPQVAWTEWLAYRRERHFPMAPRTLRMQLRVLAKFDSDTQREMLETAIQAGWQGVFPPRGKKSQPQSTGPAKTLEGIKWE